jgi:hypothetical protein
VEVIDNNIKHALDAQTDMKWVDFVDKVHDQFGKPHAKVQLVYRIGDSGVMSYLAHKDDWDKAMEQLRGRIKAARTRAVSMEVKNMVSDVHKMTKR